MGGKRWTEEDLTLLKHTYKKSNTVGGVGGNIEYPGKLLKRHTVPSCQQKASKLQLTKHFVERKIFIEDWPDFDIGYFAGIVDGEGCIHCDKKHRVYRLHVSNTDTDLMEWLKERIGMGSYYREPTRQREHWTPAYTFVISAVCDLLGILKAIEPYLIIKKQRAQEAIRILEVKLGERRQVAPNRA